MKAEELRKSILQYAIQGNLVPQIDTEEPASILLEKIKIKKSKLIRLFSDGKLRAGRALSSFELYAVK